ncbi:MAG TPA: hypothetical protein VKQ28_07775 [Candidatus Acidoferrum sp.]|nr:hypothetical protein [Candidatus Acidoferrum sp.]
MGERPDQIERHIYEQRTELGENINELQQKVKTAVDWRAQFDQRPLTMMGLAFGGGVVLSLLFGGGGRRHRSPRDWPRERNQLKSQIDYSSNRQQREGERGAPSWGDTSTWQNIRGAALAVAGTRIGALIEQMLPGFQEQYKRREETRGSPTSRPNGPESGIRKTTSGETDYMPRS